MAGDIAVIQAVTLTSDELIDRADAAIDAIREHAGATINANSVELRLWIAALLVASLDGVVVGKDPEKLFRDRLARLRKVKEGRPR